MRRSTADRAGRGGRGARRNQPDDGPSDDSSVGALEIEFEDDGASAGPPPAPAGRSRDLRPLTMTSLAVALLGAALWASHGTTAGTSPGGSLTVTLAPPNYAVAVVTVGYQGSQLLSLEQRRIEVRLRVTPVPGAQVRIISYYISENGVQVHADPVPSMTPLPASGVDVRLDLTVTDCSAVPIGESMASVDVVADGPIGMMDRFTILGERYSADLARLLRTVCPLPANGQSQGATTVVAGS